MEKECSCCKSTKPIVDYYTMPGCKDGHMGKCKECHKKAVRQRRFDPKYRERILAYDRARGNRQGYEYVKNYRTANPNKYKAHSIVNHAIKSGKLFPQPCELCGANDNLHAHHDDYLKPLNVRWLCVAHHRQWHSENGEGKNP